MITFIIVGIIGFLYSLLKKVKELLLLRTHKIQFINKLVWITGASSGIGEALAIAFSNLGADLILSSRNSEALERVRKACNPKSNIQIVPMDLSDPLKSREIVERHLTQLNGRSINIFIHNAGVSQRSLFTDFSYKNHEYMVNLNYNGPFAITQPLVKYMSTNIQQKARNSSQIVIISSMAAKLSPGFRSTYSSTKAALSSLFDSIRIEVQDQGMKITQIYPGYIRSYGSQNALIAVEGERQGGTDDDLKKSMDLVILFLSYFYKNVFTQKCIEAIFLERNESMISASWDHQFGEIVKILIPEFFTYMSTKHFRKSRDLPSQVKKND